ncbi:MAG: DUF3488 and DUF4129 domain-containing transglutaminase family protein [Gammaproteobacteria bacterium]
MNTTTYSAAAANPSTKAAPTRKKRSLIRLKDGRRNGPKLDALKLNWTLGFLVLSALPFLTHLPLWPVALVIGASAWRWWLRRRGGRIPHALLRYTMTLTMAGVVYTTFGTFNGIEPGSSLLLVMAAMKLLESVTVRDLLVLVFMSFFMILAAFLFDQSLISTAIALALVWIGTTTLVQVNRDTTPESPGKVFKQAGRIVVQAVPLLLLLFLLFPRIPGPFWALPTTDSGQTGLSDSMSPGSISNLLQSSQIAFRAYFEDEQPARSQLYWRGPVLEVLEGRNWSVRRVQTAPSDVQLQGPAINYTMVLEPHQTKWLLALEFVHKDSLPRFGEFSPTGELVSRNVVTERRRMKLQSHPIYTFALNLDSAQRTLNLDTSNTNNPRTKQLAKAWSDKSTSPAEVVNMALEHFNREAFVYSLTDARIADTNSVDSFLFDRRRGFCEHYASSFALLMRFAGIPARVVTGYMGGEVNGITGHTTVRQSDAHAWSEVWLEGRGWTRVDPTAAVAPERVEQGISGALPDGEFLPTLMMGSSGVMTGLRQAMDALNANWNNWVLGYSDERQWSLLERFGLKNRSLSSLLILLMASVGSVLFLLTLWLKYRSRYTPKDPVLRVFHTFKRRLERFGVAAQPTEDAVAFGQRASLQVPEQANVIKQFCALYQQTRYSRVPPEEALKKMRLLLRQLRPGLKSFTG